MESLDGRIANKIAKAELILGHSIDTFGELKLMQDGKENIYKNYKIVAGSNELDISFLGKVGKLFIEFPVGMSNITLKFPSYVRELTVLKCIKCSFDDIEGLENVESSGGDIFNNCEFNCKVKLSMVDYDRKGFNDCHFRDDIIIMGYSKDSSTLNYRQFMYNCVFDENINIYMYGIITFGSGNFNSNAKVNKGVTLRYKALGKKGELCCINASEIIGTEGNNKMYLDFGGTKDIAVCTVFGSRVDIDDFSKGREGRVEVRLPDRIERGFFYKKSLVAANIKLVNGNDIRKVLYLGKAGLKRYAVYVGRDAFRNSSGIFGLDLEYSVCTNRSSFEGMKDLVLAKICMNHIYRNLGRRMVAGYSRYTNVIGDIGRPERVSVNNHLFKDCEKLRRVMIDLNNKDILYYAGLREYRDSTSGMEGGSNILSRHLILIIMDNVMRSIKEFEIFKGCVSLEDIIITKDNWSYEIGKISGEAIKDII